MHCFVLFFLLKIKHNLVSGFIIIKWSTSKNKKLNKVISTSFKVTCLSYFFLGFHCSARSNWTKLNVMKCSNSNCGCYLISNETQTLYNALSVNVRDQTPSPWIFVSLTLNIALSLSRCGALHFHSSSLLCMTDLISAHLCTFETQNLKITQHKENRSPEMVNGP